MMGWAAFPAPRAAHEVPADVVVRAFVKAEDGALWLVVRVPLASMRDVEFPVRGPGYVDLAAVRPLLADQAALWIAEYATLWEGSVRLPTPEVAFARVSLPSDPSFSGYDRALRHVRSGPRLSPGIDLVLEQAMLDVILRVPVASEASRFSIDPAWAHLGLRTSTVLRYVTPGETERIYQYDGNPGRVRLDPRWHQAFLRFVAMGFAHILDGADHLLFLLCLAAPLRRLWPLVSVATAFTVAHSMTLAASVLGLTPRALWFPPLVETLIAASILWMAVENVVAKRLDRRWKWAFAFGLVHGFGFSFLLRESLQFAGAHLWTSLLAFNVGVELGQLAVLVVLAGAAAWLLPARAGAGRRRAWARAAGGRSGRVRVRPERERVRRTAKVLISVVVAHSAWHWTAERWDRLTAYDFRVPEIDAAFGAAALRWVLLLLAALGVAWLLGGVYRRLEAGLPSAARLPTDGRPPKNTNDDKSASPSTSDSERPRP